MSDSVMVDVFVLCVAIILIYAIYKIYHTLNES